MWWSSNLFFISPVRLTSGETNRYWKWLGPVGTGRRAQSFFTAQFPWCSFRKRTGRRERERALELSLIFSFLLVLRARSVSGGFKKGTVMITCRVVTHLFRLARACELVHVRLFSLSLLKESKRWRRNKWIECTTWKGIRKASRKRERKTKRKKQEVSSLFSPFTVYTRIYYWL
jgi:hypothetical protein